MNALQNRVQHELEKFCMHRVAALRKIDALYADDMQKHQVLVNSCGAPESMADRPVELLRMGPNELSALRQNVIYRGIPQIEHEINNDIVLVWQCAGAAFCWSSIVQRSRGL